MNQTTHHTPSLTATAAIPGAPVSLPRGGEFLTCRPPASVARISAHPTYPLRATAGTPTAPASFPRPIKALSVSAGIPTGPISLPGGRPFLTCRLPGSRSAFTLVELLVVIVILAMLAGLVTVAASRALTTARNAAIKAEIDMLHMAIMNYKNEYGSFPPCADATGYDANGPASKHLKRLFPRCQNPTGNILGQGLASPQFAGNPPLNPANALVAWLNGFTNNPALPLTGGTEKNKLFAFDSARLDTNRLVYFPSAKPGSPYIYITSSEYTRSWPTGSDFTYATASNNYRILENSYAAQPNLATSDTTDFMNPDTFQILCAGPDEVFGTDDDLSNFWPRTRKDYLDSLSQ